MSDRPDFKGLCARLKDAYEEKNRAGRRFGHAEAQLASALREREQSHIESSLAEGKLARAREELFDELIHTAVMERNLLERAFAALEREEEVAS